MTGKTRWRDFPDVPTVEEQGIPGFEVISWTGLAGPAKLPQPIVDKLNAEVRRAIAVPEVKSKLEAMGGDPRATTPAEMRALVASQLATWASSPRKRTSRSIRRWLDARRVGRSGCVGGVVRVY